jgi:hypothetical protein
MRKTTTASSRSSERAKKEKKTPSLRLTEAPVQSQDARNRQDARRGDLFIRKENIVLLAPLAFLWRPGGFFSRHRSEENTGNGDTRSHERVRERGATPVPTALPASLVVGPAAYAVCGGVVAAVATTGKLPAGAAAAVAAPGVLATGAGVTTGVEADEGNGVTTSFAVMAPLMSFF